MGSGKGKTKRARAVSSPPKRETTTKPEKQSVTPTRKKPIIQFEGAKWGNFVKNTSLKDVKLSRYYLNREARKENFSDYETIIRELFADGVNAGAIPLPAPYHAEDFEFELIRQDNRSHRLTARFKDDRKLEDRKS